jgi:hypothetical protein
MQNGFEMVREALRGSLGHTVRDLEAIVVDHGPDSVIAAADTPPEGLGG